MYKKTNVFFFLLNIFPHYTKQNLAVMIGYTVINENENKYRYGMGEVSSNSCSHPPSTLPIGQESTQMC